MRPCRRCRGRRPTRLQKWLKEAVETGNPVWPEWVKGVEAMRADAARLIGAQPDEIALVGNTTAGISLVAEGIDWRPGDNVVTLADEFPSNVYPWFNLESRGVETRRVPTDVSGRLDLEQLAEACDERTRDRHGELDRLCDRLPARCAARSRPSRISAERYCFSMRSKAWARFRST